MHLHAYSLSREKSSCILHSREIVARQSLLELFGLSVEMGKLFDDRREKGEGRNCCLIVIECVWERILDLDGMREE